ncbi:nucleotide exchange factor GrpE [Oleiharenicola lentus]|jgi:molecular chaperone GrpE|uniref:Protein GrpE n=1 Tax=Oleiharenicola lentus TaxID=2508720 RepID=A0A4Q1C493_9BACT|nr:nucleotide exchange factor GrpE [Oleiharenicola lentus]RXK53181.1 nucleotide exchange factor GrpE [Oleiharenicola lentus]
MSENSQTETTQPNPAPAGATAEPAPAPAAPSLEEQLAAAKKESAANYDRYTRAVADLENFRKRTVREKDELRQFAASGVMEDIIPILDNLGLGLGAAKQQTDVKAITDGITLVLEQFKSTLAKHGLKEINPQGQAFDPNLHDCISHQPSAEVPEEKVSMVVRLGYSLNGRLLRPASVVVSSGPAKPAEAKD